MKTYQFKILLQLLVWCVAYDLESLSSYLILIKDKKSVAA